MNDNYVQSIIKGFKILELFKNGIELLGISDMKEYLNYPNSTIHRLVSTLEYCGYLRQDKLTSKYRLGINSYILGSNVQFIKELKYVAKPHLKTMSGKYNEVMHLAIQNENKVLCIEKINSSRSLSVTPSEGETNFIHATSVGKCLLAFDRDLDVKEFLNSIELIKLTNNTITDIEAFSKELEKVREEGCALDLEESEIGLTCVGAPIFNSHGKCIAAISFSIPNARFDYDIEELKLEVKAVAKQISNKL